MQKSNLIWAFSILIFIKAQSQNTGAIIYQFKHQKDTTTPMFYEEEMILYFSAKNTAYKSYTAIKQDSIIKSHIEKNLQSGGRIHLGRIKPTTKQNYYRDFKSEKVFVESRIGEDNYLYEDTLRPITWQLLNDEKLIGGFRCKAAKTNYFGRNYIVWYSIDFPIQGGPWKLYGLPGLILQATDERNQVSFEFIGILQVSLSDEEISPPKVAIKTTKKDFFKTLDIIRQNPQLSNNGLPISISNNTTNQNRQIFNNPIELR